MIRITCPCCSHQYELENEEIEENLRFFCWNCSRKLIYVRGKVIPFALEQPSQGGSRKIRCPFCDGKNPMDEEDNGVFLCRNCGQSFYVLPSNGVPPPLPSELAQNQTAETAMPKPFKLEKISAVSPSTPTESIPRMTPSPLPRAETVIPKRPVPPPDIPVPPPVRIFAPQTETGIPKQPVPPTGIPAPPPVRTSAPQTETVIPKQPVPPTGIPAPPPVRIPAPGPQASKPASKLLDFSGENREMFFSGGTNAKVKVGLPRPRSGISGFFIGISEALCGKR